MTNEVTSNNGLVKYLPICTYSLKMFEADTDDDYFVPSPGTSLTTIFNKKLIDKKELENPTLKYVAPKASSKQDGDTFVQSDSSQADNTKTSECIFACAVYAYELISDIYTSRGKLGLAIMKLFTPPHTKLVLYDSNKKTLSAVNISPNLDIIIQSNKYITYYDNLRKNWSLSCCNLEEFNLFLNKLRDQGIRIIFHEETSKNPNTKSEHILRTNPILPDITKDESDKESDTDSSINKRTKASILSRMAVMGQSVLPPPAAVEKTSDSSDTDLDAHYKARHKPSKNIIKKINLEKNTTEIITVPISDIASSNKNQPVLYTPVQTTQRMHLSSDSKGQLVPINSFTREGLNCDKYDMNIFISEYHTSNSEMRININRLSDKLDSVSDKIKSFESEIRNQSVSDFTKDLFQKLINEYETKIKEQDRKIIMLEKSLSQRNAEPKELESYAVMLETEVEHDIKQKLRAHEQEVFKLERENNDNLNAILALKREIDVLRNSLLYKDTELSQLQEKNDKLLLELSDKTKELNIINSRYTKACDDLDQLKLKLANIDHKLPNEDSTHRKLKLIMNDTFRSLSSNFQNNESYSGDTVKNIVATVIKKTTIDSFNSYS